MYDCIAAISTAHGTGGVAIIRLSGKEALSIAKKMFAAQKEEYTPNYMYAGNISGEGFTDYGFMVYFKAPRSFTGEDIVEFHCHGGVQIARGILKKCLSLGARAAERGEFTKRAFLNGKLSLSSAEGMADMINAESLALVRAGSMMYTEKLTREVVDVQNKLKDVLAEVAVEIDYPEEDSDGADLQGISKKLDEIRGLVSGLASSYKSGKKIKDGVTVALCGKPNAGKSSLLNALLGYDRAIVSSVAGTTRDVVEGCIEIDGVKYNLTDTAGIRESAGEVESIGIERAKNAIKCADIVLFITDCNEEFSEEASGKVIKVFNKSDIKKPGKTADICVSAKTGEGIEQLKKLIAQSAVGEFSLDKAYIVEERHFSALLRAEQSLNSAFDGIATLTLDLVAVDLKDAWDALGEITGETATEEIISTVFEKFCVGK
ncbi:MAG: tRNA uridine-5-carboxymethylaminomethyl(34) synthesis GTPase MnmE [Clostridia bacterium]|nr:tRNA uridine-5-carboxymethylaminomethyl(34) synthesis GTPase MnmE [Clostridia bacterium]